MKMMYLLKPLVTAGGDQAIMTLFDVTLKTPRSRGSDGTIYQIMKDQQN